MKCPNEVRFDYIITFNLKLKCVMVIGQRMATSSSYKYSYYSVHIITECSLLETQQ